MEWHGTVFPFLKVQEGSRPFYQKPKSKIYQKIKKKSKSKQSHMSPIIKLRMRLICSSSAALAFCWALIFRFWKCLLKKGQETKIERVGEGVRRVEEGNASTFSLGDSVHIPQLSLLSTTYMVDIQIRTCNQTTNAKTNILLPEKKNAKPNTLFFFGPNIIQSPFTKILYMYSPITW